MKVNDLKDLEKLIKLCRRLGVDAIEADNVKLNLGKLPQKSKMRDIASDIPEANVQIPEFNGKIEETAVELVDANGETIKTDSLTDEQLLFYSVTGEQSTAEAN